MKKKIYITALHMRHGGIEMAISLLSNALVKRDYEVNVLSVYNLGEPAYQLDERVKITYLTDVRPNKEAFLSARRERNFLKMLKEGMYSLKVLYLKRKAIKDAIQSIQEGIVISTRNEHSVILSRYGKQDVYKIAQLHHDHEFKKKYLRDFARRYQNIDIFVLLTELLRNEVEDIMRSHNSYTRCVAIPNFLDLTDVQNCFEHKEKTVIAVGRLHAVKGFERLINIWKHVSEQCPDWKLKIIGGGELESALLNQVKELGLEEKIEITGMLGHEAVMQEMCRGSLFVMTSYSEAFPFVLIEAMANGLPIVAFDVRVGPRAIIDDGQNGFLIEDNNYEAFVQNVNMLLADQEKCFNMGKNAILKAMCFSEEEVLKKWISILEQK